jgi:hypothetical protein
MIPWNDHFRLSFSIYIATYMPDNVILTRCCSILVTLLYKRISTHRQVKLRRRQTKLSEVVVMSVVGVVSGYYIFNDIFKQVSDEETGSNIQVDNVNGSLVDHPSSNTGTRNDS